MTTFHSTRQNSLVGSSNYHTVHTENVTCVKVINPLMGTGNYSATSNNMKLVHWPLMGGLLQLVQRGGAPQTTDNASSKVTVNCSF